MPQSDVRNTFGNQYYCKLLIKGEEYNPSIIFSLVIREWVVDHLPRLELILVDDGTLSEVFPLEDNDQIDITIATNEDNSDDSHVQMSFTMLDYKINPYRESAQFVKISGFMKTNDIFSSRNRSFSNVNSSTVLADIADEEGVMFVNPWNVTPSDNMTWYQYNLNNYDFIRHVLRRSHITDDAAFFYGNSNGSFIFTSLRSETDKSDVTFARRNIDKATKFALAEEDVDTIWFDNYDIVNFNGYNNKICGYGATYTYFDLADIVTNTLFYRNLYGELSFRDRTKVTTNGANPSCSPVYGHMNNVYDEYFESLVRNPMLIKQFFSFSLVINANGLSKVNLFDKINLIMPAYFGGRGKTDNDNDVNEVMSGEYLVGGITHKISSGGVYNKMISLHRDGMNKSPYLTNYTVEENERG